MAQLISHDESFDKVEEFHKEFKDLVRKYVPEYPKESTDFEVELLAMLQDKTSVYSPYVWSDEDDKKVN